MLVVGSPSCWGGSGLLAAFIVAAGAETARRRQPAMGRRPRAWLSPRMAELMLFSAWAMVGGCPRRCSKALPWSLACFW